MKKISFYIFIVIVFAVSCGDKNAETLEEYQIRMRNAEILKYYNIQEVMPPRVVDDGILFTFAENYDSVEVSGDFNNWEDSIPLIKNSYGIFYYLCVSSPIHPSRSAPKGRLWVFQIHHG